MYATSASALADKFPGGTFNKPDRISKGIETHEHIHHPSERMSVLSFRDENDWGIQKIVSQFGKITPTLPLRDPLL